MQQLRRGVGRRAVGQGLTGGGTIKQPGHAEIHQHRLAIVADQDVGRFQVTVQHQPRMRLLHRLADHLEQLQARGQIQLALRAPHIQRHPLDVLHHQVGLATVGGATVIQAGNVRVLQ